MSYAGNPSLAPDARQRILETFRHTLDVAGRGSLEEARLGCDFILRMDPLFKPAQQLADRLRGANGPVPVSDLQQGLGDGGSLPTAGGEPGGLADLGTVKFTLPTAPPASGAALHAELSALAARRDFTSLMRRAGELQAAVDSDPQLQQLMASAMELMEAAPYVERFLQKAKTAMAAGNLPEAQAAVEKARALDPSHPGLAALLAGPPTAAPAAFAAAPPAALAPPPPRPPAPPSSGPPPPAQPFAASPPPAAPGFAPSSPSALRPPDLGPPDLGPPDLPAGDSFDMSLGEELPLDLPPLGDLPDLDTVPGTGLSLEDMAMPGMAPAPPPPGGASDADPRIAELLDEGEVLAARGELQGAIDAWSRIFLIDIDHQEAARRIDQARSAKAEQERQVEELYHEALARVQSGAVQEGRAALQRVLAMQPNHLAAREALEKIERGEVTDLPRPRPLLGGDAAAADAVLQEEILVPPEPGERPRASAPPAEQPARSKRKLLVVAALLAAVLGTGGWFLSTRWSSLFPNAEEPAPVATSAPPQTPITRASQLAAEGKRAVAIAQLKRVPPPSPYYEEAQALIAQWEAEEAAARDPVGPSPEQIARREELVAQAREAAATRRYLAVGPFLDQAAAIAPLSLDEQGLRAEATEALEALRAPLELIRGEEYALALRQLWLDLEKDNANGDVRHLLLVAYYNLGVVSLQSGQVEEAESNLAEAAALDPGDLEVERLLMLARTYQGRMQDLQYRIYVKYLDKREV